MNTVASPFAISTKENRSGNITMDNPNVSISDLFANVRESLERYERKQSLAKQKRLARRNGHHKGGASDAADKKPLFGSLLNPQWNSNSRAPGWDLDKEASAQRCLSLLKGNISHAGSTPSRSSDIVPLGTPSSSIASTYAKSIPNISVNDSIIINEEEEGKASIPEYVPLCKRQRRSKRVALEKLRAVQANEKRKFKPLLFSKPLFNLPGNVVTMDCGESSSSASTPMTRTVSISSPSTVQTSKKRKASENEPIADCNGVGLGTTFSRPISGSVALSTFAASSVLPNGFPSSSTPASTVGSSPLTSSSSIFSYGGMSTGAYSYSYNRRTWTKDEVDGLLGFANRWITKDMSKRQRRG